MKYLIPILLSLCLSTLCDTSFARSKKEQAIIDTPIAGTNSQTLDAENDAEDAPEVTKTGKQKSTSASEEARVLNIESYEDNLIGYSWNTDDKPFMDAKLSLVYALKGFERLVYKARTHFGIDTAKISWRLKFGFTEQFGFYISNRVSSPVVQKRFNPSLFIEGRLIKKNLFWEIGYAHESNGQSIQDSATFYSLAKNVHSKDGWNEDIRETQDQISRGWDYIAVRAYWNSTNIFGYTKWCFQPDISYRGYLKNGVLQGYQENYRPWERAWSGAGYTRSEVSGLSATISFIHNVQDTNCFSFTKATLKYETGTENTFQNNTYRIMLVGNLFYFPAFISYTSGYNINIANYGKPINSFAVGLMLNSFSAPFIKRKK